MAGREGRSVRAARRWLVSALLVVPALAAAAGGDGGGWRVGGFADTRHAAQVRAPGRFVSSHTRLRGEVTAMWSGAQLHASAGAAYSPLYGEPLRLDLREAYIDLRREHWGFRVGRQLVIWGMADGVRVTDLVSPMDMREFLAQDYDDIRMPVNALRLFAHGEWVRAEVVAVPLFEGYRLPTEGSSPWSILPQGLPLPAVWRGEASRPAFNLKNMEYGGRISFTLPGVDFSISGLYTWNKMPVLSYTPTISEIGVRPRHYRMGFVGLDMAKPLGAFVVRGEAAYNIDKHLSNGASAWMLPVQGYNTLHWLVGLDWYGPREWMVSAQFSSETIFGHKAHLAVPAHGHLATLHVSKRLLESAMEVASFTYYDFHNRGWFSRLSVEYAIDDHVRVAVGGDWLEGQEGLFERYKGNTSAWLRVRYYF